jgi:hypothetical protein
MADRHRERHEHHIVVAVFDSTSNARIEGATVTARISGLGLSGSQVTLQPMKIADTVSCGTYFNLTPDPSTRYFEPVTAPALPRKDQLIVMCC